MGRMMNFVTPLHTRTPRDYMKRMLDNKLEAVAVAKQYGRDFWDGDRRYGYGGYRYDGRWKSVAEQLIATYGLRDGASILDVGCGKGFLLHELKLLLPNARAKGFDISQYAIDSAPETVRDDLFVHRAQDPFPFPDKSFDLVVSVGACHNLRIFELETAIREIERVGCHKYFMVESYRNELELRNLECWALTCESFFDVEEWIWLFDHFGYTGDYEFIFFE